MPWWITRVMGTSGTLEAWSREIAMMAVSPAIARYKSADAGMRGP